jgi:hypothetical protein
MENQEIRILFLAGAKDFSLLYSSQTASGPIHSSQWIPETLSTEVK